MDMKKVAAWLRQPTTVLGFSAALGTVIALLTGQMHWQAAVPAIAGSLVAVALPDNSGAKVAVQNAATAIVAAEQAVVNVPAK